ncbi:helix-turn-helix transcriptional regulator [Halococcus hamelinensis]|uniref:HTH iclR-type domain-containing protein n=1 Tax=Halococcus hamelinensis 100A6 TaxID=1132509 RepID=M0M4K9_9EURY|nr:hypothetical protein [Halococcus hamelinensis]EMA39539.1 hypothetical protein C447_06161 [Halococcus hamelinensis 100A6]
MRSRAVLGLAIVVVAVVALAAPVSVAAQSSADEPTATNATSTTTIVIQPQPNGDARFSFETRFVLDDANDTAAFRTLGEAFEAGDAGISASTFRRAANTSSVATGRSMNVTNVSRNATIATNGSGSDIGRLTLGFTWAEFARTADGRIMVGDAFNGTQGTWLPGLTERQTLLVKSPPDYGVIRSPTGAGFANGTVRFEGPASFSEGTPVVWFERRGNQPATSTPGSDSGLFGSVPPLAVGSVLLVIGVVVAGAYAMTRRDDESDGPGDGTAGAARAGTADPPGPSDEPDETTVLADVDEELLSDEERVERLLAANDGRMKQASIVEATGWSNAKVSQLLSAMDEDGRVNKLRIGRENLISLPDEE